MLMLGGVLVGLANAAIPEEIWEQFVRSQMLAAGQELPSDLATPVAIARWGSIHWGDGLLADPGGPGHLDL